MLLFLIIWQNEKDVVKCLVTFCTLFERGSKKKNSKKKSNIKMIKKKSPKRKSFLITCLAWKRLLNTAGTCRKAPIKLHLNWDHHFKDFFIELLIIILVFFCIILRTNKQFSLQQTLNV